MKGTEKQIAWAEKIKAHEIASIDQKIHQYDRFASGEMDDYDGSELRFHEQALQAKNILVSIDLATWWIDNRQIFNGICFAILRNLQKKRDPFHGFKN
jgi:hypothetical protein